MMCDVPSDPAVSYMFMIMIMMAAKLIQPLTVTAALLSTSPPTSLGFTASVLRASRRDCLTLQRRRRKNIVAPSTPSSLSSSSLAAAKRRKNRDDGSSYENQWYDDVTDGASPEDVFWDEMERRRNQSGFGSGDGGTMIRGASPIDMVGSFDANSGDAAADAPNSMASTIASQAAASLAGDDFLGPGSGAALSQRNPGATVAEERSADATLASYSAFAVSDNYLYDDDGDDEPSTGILRNDPSLWEGEDPTLEEENAELNRQLDDLERELLGDGVDGSVVGGSSPFFDPNLSNEPWDRYGESRTVDVSDEDGASVSSFQKELGRRMEMVRKGARELTLEYDDEHPDEAAAEAAREEDEYVALLESIGMTSPRLENAAVNPKAEAYFKRPTDELQGYDTMWVSAINQQCIRNLYGIFRDYGVQFADNFDDWDNGNDGDEFRSIEDIASYKARRVFAVTGLPCIASRTSFEVEPIRPEDMDKTPVDGANAAGGKAKPKPGQKSPRVVTGYQFNDVGEHVDRVVQSLLPFSEPTRVTRFRSCVCYYDGEMELFEYGELDCDLHFSGSLRTYIPMSAAINSMLKSLELALDLQFQKWLHAKVNDATGGGTHSDASINLRDRVLKEAKVLPNDIVDVSTFMDACVDVDLMDQCGKELAGRFESFKPNKILTIATTGLVIAIRKSCSRIALDSVL